MYLIIRLEPAGNSTLPENKRLPPIAQYHKRVSRETYGVAPRLVETILLDHGYDLGPVTGGVLADTDVWPITAIVYTSLNKEGKGRSGSQVHCYGVRAFEKDYGDE